MSNAITSQVPYPRLRIGIKSLGGHPKAAM
jgi:hypothetical protein